MFCHMLQIEAGRHENLLMADCTFSVKKLLSFLNVMSCLYRIEMELYILQQFFKNTNRNWGT